MGYSTWFSGSLKFNKEVSEELREYINRFSSVRHMSRDNDKIKEIYPNWKELCFLGEIGNNGEYFAPISKNHGQEHDNSILDYNRSGSCPGLWCQWIIENDELIWDEGEKFYNYVEWLHYLIDNFFDPLGYVLNGEITWDGEDSDDIGTITVTDNYVEVEYGVHLYSMSDMSDSELITELEKRGYKVS